MRRGSASTQAFVGLATILAALLAPASAAAAPTLSASPTSGPPGLVVAVSGVGLTPGTTYSLCMLPPDQTQSPTPATLPSGGGDNGGLGLILVLIVAAAAALGILYVVFVRRRSGTDEDRA